MKFVIVTGMSGGGKRTALKMLEDIGFYCVDNLPIPLIEKFMELVALPGSEINKVALGLDVRAGQPFDGVADLLTRMKENGHSFDILFMECQDQVLLKRYKESRRLHPLSPEGRVEEGITRERGILAPVRAISDYVIDTSKLLTRELQAELDRIFVNNEEYNSLIVNVVSFGFKNGIPQDADLVFDVRFLPNPFYIDELKHKTGQDKEVYDYVMGFPEAKEFLSKLADMVEFLIPNYVKEGKYQLVIAIGCTGGKHRSVTLARALYQALEGKGSYGLTIGHRDIVVGA